MNHTLPGAQGPRRNDQNREDLSVFAQIDTSRRRQAPQPPPPQQTQFTLPGAQGAIRRRVALTLGLLSLVAWLIPLFGFPVCLCGLAACDRESKDSLTEAAYVLCWISLVLTALNAAGGAYLGAIGHHPVVNWIQTL